MPISSLTLFRGNKIFYCEFVLLVSATIAVIATTYWDKFVYIVIPAVPHVDVLSTRVTALSSVTETDSFTYSSISHTRMSICQPARCGRTTPPVGCARGRHSGSCGPFKTIPAFSDAPVTIPMVGCVGYLSVCSIKALVVLTF